MATRYFQTAVDGREDMDFLYQLPIEQIQSLTQFNDEMTNQTTTALRDNLEEQFKQYNAYGYKQSELEGLKDMYRESVNSIASSIASDQRADAWKSQLPNLRTLGSQLKNDLSSTGRIGKLNQDYKDIMAATTAANKNIKNASYRQKYVEDLTSKYEKYGKVSPRQIFEEINIQERIMNKLKNMKANKELSEDVDLGDIAKTLTTKGYSGISSDRVLKAALSGISSDYELMAYIKEMSDLGVVGFNNVIGKDEDGNYRFNFTEEIEVTGKDGKKSRMITPANNVIGQSIQSAMDILSYSETINKEDKSYSPIYVAKQQKLIDIEKEEELSKMRDKGKLDPTAKILFDAEMNAASKTLQSELEFAAGDPDKMKAAQDRYSKAIGDLASKYNPNVTISNGGMAEPGKVMFNPLEGKNGYSDLVDVANKGALQIKNLNQARLELENDINSRVARGEPVPQQLKVKLDLLDKQLNTVRNEYNPYKKAVDKIEEEILKEFDDKFKTHPEYHKMRSYLASKDVSLVNRGDNTWIERFFGSVFAGEVVGSDGTRRNAGPVQNYKNAKSINNMAEWYKEIREEKFAQLKQAGNVELPTSTLNPNQAKLVWEDINSATDDYIAFAQNPKNVAERNDKLISPSVATIKNILAKNNMKMEDAFDRVEMTSGISGKSGSYILKVKDGVNIEDFYEPGSKIIIQPTNDVAIQRVVGKMASTKNILVGQEPVFNAILNKGINDFEINMATAPKYAGSNGKIPEIRHIVEAYNPLEGKTVKATYIIEPISDGGNGVESYKLYKEVVDNKGVNRVPIDASRNISENNSFSSIESLRVAIFGL